jgi:hypothetical protein
LSTIVRLADAIQGHAGHSVASTYRHFDLETLAKGVASIPVPGEKSSPQINADVAIAAVTFGVGMRPLLSDIRLM